MVSKIRTYYRLTIGTIVLSVISLAILANTGFEKELAIKFGAALFSLSFFLGIYTNYLLKKAKKINTSNIVVWVVGSLILFPLSYFGMLYILGGTIEEYANENSA
jgi:hypothetical protein